VKDTLGDGILSSYPIKVTHLKKTLSILIKQCDKDKWTRENIGKNVVEIVRAVDKDGERNKLIGLFLRDDNIMAESDRSYLESRRILDELKNRTADYKIHGCLHLISWLIIVLCSIGIIGMETAVWTQIDWSHFQNACAAYRNNKTKEMPPYPLDRTFLFVYSILSWLLLLTNLISLCVVYLQTFTWQNLVFRVLPNLRAFYVVTSLAAAALCAFDIFIVVDFIIANGCIHLGHWLTITLSAWTIRFLSSIPIFLVVISFIVNAKDCRACKSYDVVFFSCPICRSKTHVDEEEDQISQQIPELLVPEPRVQEGGEELRASFIGRVSLTGRFPSLIRVSPFGIDTLDPGSDEETLEDS
jgi:hypothetical protein